MSKEITDAKSSLKIGIDKVADAVKITLGPLGRNVALESSFGLPTITNDGVSIAKFIELEDAVENMGAEIVKDVASKTNDIAGDGTTTSIILTQALVSEGLKHTSVGIDAIQLRREMESASLKVVAGLKEMAKPITTKNEIKQVASISAESEELGQLIANAFELVGNKGIVKVEESQLDRTEIDHTDGTEFDRGFTSPNFITNREKQEVEILNPYILITDKKISNLNEISVLLEQIIDSGKKEIVIIADDFEQEVINQLVINKLGGYLKCAAIKAPGFGDDRKPLLEDLASIVGATIISDETGIGFSGLNHLGKATQVIVRKDSTLIIGGAGKIDLRVKELTKQKNETDSKYEKAKFDSRIAKLSGSIAVIRVGASTETSMRYLRDKLEDAVNATKSAIEEGIVIGGGSALVKVSFADETLGADIVRKALEAPLRQIAKNAGLDDGVILNIVKKGGKNSGYDFKRNVEIKDMIKFGIIDPVKVTRTALENSVSAAATLLTTELAITEKKND